MKDEELLMLDEAKDRLADKLGVPLSRNSYIRNLLFALMKKDRK
jgi:hypothetical protein